VIFAFIAYRCSICNGRKINLEVQKWKMVGHVGRASNSAKKATPPMVNSIDCLKLRIFRVFAEVKSLSAA